jgi:hypothetical protein
MVTLSRFNDAYATMTVAVYEPLALGWFSAWSLYLCADTMARRAQRSRPAKGTKLLPTALQLGLGQDAPRRPGLDPSLRGTAAAPPTYVDTRGRPFTAAQAKPVTVTGYPRATLVGPDLFPRGALGVVPPSGREPGPGNLAAGIRTLAMHLRPGIGVRPGFNHAQSRETLFQRLMAGAQAAAATPGKSLANELRRALADAGGAAIPDFLPAAKIESAVSPLGVMHLYRQLYFNGDEGLGPIEHAFTVAPLETLEIVFQNTRRQIHDELVETGLEVTRETREETKNLEEVSDKVSSMINRDASVAVGAEATGWIGVWQTTVSGEVNLGISSQNAREQSSRRLKEVTRQAAERITKSMTVTTRHLDDTEVVNLTRRTIRNESATPVSYAQRRVLRRVRVKVQDLGPRLVWQVYVRDPGVNLSRSHFVHYREAEDIAVPDVPPGLPPRPAGGTEVGQASSVVSTRQEGDNEIDFVSLSIHAGADREIKAVTIDSITDLAGGGIFNPEPAPRNDRQWDLAWDEETRTFTAKVAIERGDSDSVSITYTYSWVPSRAVMEAWETQRQQAVAEATQESLSEQFERAKSLITERSRVLPRPASDLRREERYEAMGRLIADVFGDTDMRAAGTPVEIELFGRFFDIDGAFVHTHPAWWRPRTASVGTAGSPAYEITADSEPAPMGSSLGWLIQIDGDARRNEFLNSPWIRVCLPMRPGCERDAIDWLSRHVEGAAGYDPAKPPLKDALDEIEKKRANEAALGREGPDYVTIDSTVGAPAGPLKPQNLYPVIDEFSVVVPTDGFVYDEVKAAT